MKSALNFMRKKVLIVSVKAGAGHLKAAEALEVCLKSKWPGIEVKNIDLLDCTNALIKFLYGQMYIDIIKAVPELFAYGYKNYEPTQKFIKPRLLIDKFNFSDFFRLVDEFNPDIVIATHFISAAILANYKQKENKKYNIIETLTDYEFHPLWLIDGIDLFAVANEEVKNGLIFHGTDENKIIVSGIPVHPKFSEPKKKDELRAKYNLTEDIPLVLILAGSFGITPLAETMEEFKKMKEDFQMLVVCGKNEKLKKEMEDFKSQEPRLKKVFGFVDFMDELMAASDILITKPGGVTVSEALAVGLPMILIEPIPGQEEANADYLIEQGAAVKARNLPSVIYKLENLLKNPEKLSQLAQATKMIGKPHAGRAIAESMLKF